jgi:hypothetical protein
VDNAGVKLLGAPIGSKDFTTDFVKKKLKALDEVCKLLREVDNAQVEFGLFRGCLSYNKINHLLRTCPPDLLQEALVKFDDHFQNMMAENLRVPCLTEDQWEQASLPVKLSGLGVNQTKVIAGPAYVGSCCLTKDLAALLKQSSSSFEHAVSRVCWLLTRPRPASRTSLPLCQIQRKSSSCCRASGTKLLSGG